MNDSTDNKGKQRDPAMGQNSNLQSGNLQSDKQDIAGDKHSTGQQGGRTQEGKQHDTRGQQGTGGQHQNQQHGGQHASGGTPALDDLNADRASRDQGSPGSESRQMDQQSGWDGKQDKQR
ncbi:hypothetical protein RCH14_003212 [Massilia sp. MP_M2]|uniref:hypothetical protein n=1 Tax=Massilia sp. MP_M2 TaxID=3071713 RepID=UPI00319DC590